MAIGSRVHGFSFTCLSLGLLVILVASSRAGALGESATISARATVVSSFGMLRGDLYMPLRASVVLEISRNEESTQTIYEAPADFDLSYVEQQALMRLEPLANYLLDSGLIPGHTIGTRPQSTALEFSEVSAPLVITMIYTEN